MEAEAPDPLSHPLPSTGRGGTKTLSSMCSPLPEGALELPQALELGPVLRFARPTCTIPSDLPEETHMNKRRQPKREKVVPVPEKDLRLAEGAAGEALAGHVDNPGQTPMKDGPA